jgi:hypothetical protein
MSKPCPWCGAAVKGDVRICPTCRSALPTSAPDPAPGQLAPPSLGEFGPSGLDAPPPVPPPPGYPTPGYPAAGYPVPAPRGSNAARTAIIAVGVGAGALVAIAMVAILAITFLGRSTSSKFVAVEPTESPASPSASGTGRDYPVQVRSNFLASCSTNAPASTCACALEEIEQAYSLGEFVDAEQEFVSTGTLPPRLTAIIQDCMQGG